MQGIQRQIALQLFWNVLLKIGALNSPDAALLFLVDEKGCQRFGGRTGDTDERYLILVFGPFLLRFFGVDLHILLFLTPEQQLGGECILDGLILRGRIGY